jgi:hypothetical protein
MADTYDAHCIRCGSAARGGQFTVTAFETTIAATAGVKVDDILFQRPACESCQREMLAIVRRLEVEAKGRYRAMSPDEQADPVLVRDHNRALIRDVLAAIVERPVLRMPEGVPPECMGLGPPYTRLLGPAWPKATG